MWCTGKFNLQYITTYIRICWFHPTARFKCSLNVLQYFQPSLQRTKTDKNVHCRNQHKFLQYYYNFKEFSNCWWFYTVITCVHGISNTGNWKKVVMFFPLSTKGYVRNSLITFCCGSIHLHASLSSYLWCKGIIHLVRKLFRVGLGQQSWVAFLQPTEGVWVALYQLINSFIELERCLPTQYITKVTA